SSAAQPGHSGPAAAAQPAQRCGSSRSSSGPSRRPGARTGGTGDRRPYGGPGGTTGGSARTRPPCPAPPTLSVTGCSRGANRTGAGSRSAQREGGGVDAAAVQGHPLLLLVRVPDEDLAVAAGTGEQAAVRRRRD